MGYRCASEPADQYVLKGGKREETAGRKCLCNGLMSDLGLEQNQKSGYREKPLVTSGNGLDRTLAFVNNRKLSYKAADVIRYLLGLLRPGNAPSPA